MESMLDLMCSGHSVHHEATQKACCAYFCMLACKMTKCAAHRAQLHCLNQACHVWTTAPCSADLMRRQNRSGRPSSHNQVHPRKDKHTCHPNCTSRSPQLGGYENKPRQPMQTSRSFHNLVSSALATELATRLSGAHQAQQSRR